MLNKLMHKISLNRKKKEEEKELKRIKETDWFKSTSSLITRMDGFYKKAYATAKEECNDIDEYLPKTKKEKKKVLKWMKEAKENANTNFIMKTVLEDYRRIDKEIAELKSFVCEPKKTLNYVNLSPNPDPRYANTGDSGFDLRAWISQTTEGAKADENSGDMYVEIGPHEVKLIHTGMYFDVPENCEIQVRPRSGFALKVGLTINNSPGTVDVEYTGEVGLICINPTNNPIRVYHGNKVAQAVLCPVYNEKSVTLVKVDRVCKESGRGSKGYGSSGI